jgi:predicted ATPase
VTRHCECREKHLRRRIVLTGGPGAGKTAVLELLRHSLCDHVAILSEAAGIIFGGGFPRHDNIGVRRAAQRAIYHVQCELEAAAEADGAGITLCDRGAIDGGAYWPGPGDLFEAVGTTRSETLKRYDAVIHLRVPDEQHGYGHQNLLRVESVVEARRIDDRILSAWDNHPRRYVIDADNDFMEKAERTLHILRMELPECCRDHTSRAIDAAKERADVHLA